MGICESKESIHFIILTRRKSILITSLEIEMAIVDLVRLSKIGVATVPAGEQ